MARCRFVQPEVVRIPLSQGDWIDVKTELTSGEQRWVFAEMVREYGEDGRAILDPEKVGRTKVSGYLVGWSFVDRAGSPVPVTDAAIDGLNVATYHEIVQAIDTHESAQDLALGKNSTDGENKSAATSPSAA